MNYEEIYEEIKKDKSKLPFRDASVGSVWFMYVNDEIKTVYFMGRVNRGSKIFALTENFDADKNSNDVIMVRYTGNIWRNRNNWKNKS